MADDLGPLFSGGLDRVSLAGAPQCAVAIKAARARLTHHRPRGSIWALLGAAGLCAGSGLALAAAVILGPPRLGVDPSEAPKPAAINPGGVR